MEIEPGGSCLQSREDAGTGGRGDGGGATAGPRGNSLSCSDRRTSWELGEDDPQRSRPAIYNEFYTSIREHRRLREAPVAWQPRPPSRIRGTKRTSGVALQPGAGCLAPARAMDCCGIGLGRGRRVLRCSWVCTFLASYRLSALPSPPSAAPLCYTATLHLDRRAGQVSV